MKELMKNDILNKIDYLYLTFHSKKFAKKQRKKFRKIEKQFKEEIKEYPTQLFTNDKGLHDFQL